MTSRAKTIITVALTAIVCIGGPTWWRKAHAWLGTVAVKPEADGHTVFWIGSGPQFDYTPPKHLFPDIGATNVIQIGFKDDGTMVWRPK